MSITFGPYSTPVEGRLNAVLPRYTAVITPEAYTALRAQMPPPAFFQGEGSLAPPVPVFVGLEAMLPALPTVDASGVYSFVGELEALLPNIDTDMRQAGARLRALLPRQRALLTVAEQGGFGFPIPLSFITSGEFEAPLIADEVGGDDGMTADWAVVLQAILRMTDTPLVLVNLQGTLTSSVIARDLFTVVLQKTLTSQVDVEDLPVATLRMMYLLADQLAVEDDSVGLLSALVLVASAVVLSSQWTPGRDGNLDSEILIDEEVAATIAAVVELIAELEIEDALLPQMIAFVLLDDGLAIDDSDMSALVSLLAELLDEVSVGIRITTGDGDTFIGYSVNTRNSAVSEYDNYPFNSFAMVGGIPFGAGPDGIYRLEGDDDDGSPINASVYTGLSDYGNSQLKKMPSAWIGLTSDGDMVLKVVTSDTGKKKENWYRMKGRPNGAPVDSRFSPAKGLNGRYWGFEIANIDGADFTLDSLKVWPLIMQRRYSGR